MKLSSSYLNWGEKKCQAMGTKVLSTRIKIDGFIHLLICTIFAFMGAGSPERIGIFALLLVVTISVTLRLKFNLLYLVWALIFGMCGMCIGLIDLNVWKVVLVVIYSFAGIISLLNVVHQIDSAVQRANKSESQM